MVYITLMVASLCKCWCDSEHSIEAQSIHTIDDGSMQSYLGNLFPFNYSMHTYISIYVKVLVSVCLCALGAFWNSMSTRFPFSFTTNVQTYNRNAHISSSEADRPTDPSEEHKNMCHFLEVDRLKLITYDKHRNGLG